MEVVSYLNKKNLPGIIVTIDFEKCFDRVEFESIRGTFKCFGFSDQFISMMFLLLSHLELCTSSNGIHPHIYVRLEAQIKVILPVL